MDRWGGADDCEGDGVRLAELRVLLKENPGLTSSAIARLLVENPTGVAVGLLYHTRKGNVSRWGQGTQAEPYRYYLPGDARPVAPVERPRTCDPDLQRRIMHRLRDMRGRDVTLRMLKHYVRAESAMQLHDAAEDLVAQGVLKRGDEVMTWRYW